MKNINNLSDFINGFIKANKRNRFSYEGFKALLTHLECIECEIGLELEFDPAGFCCVFKEYNLNDLIEEYELEGDFDLVECALNYFCNETSVIVVKIADTFKDTRVIIRDF